MDDKTLENSRKQFDASKSIVEVSKQPEGRANAMSLTPTTKISETPKKLSESLDSSNSDFDIPTGTRSIKVHTEDDLFEKFPKELPSKVLPTNSFEKCTVKEFIDEILDCTILIKPSSLNEKLKAVSETTNREEIPNIRSRLNIQNEERAGSSKTQCTVKEILDEIWDYTVCRKRSSAYGMCHRSVEVSSELGVASTSQYPENIDDYRYKIDTGREEYHLYSGLGPGIIYSTTDFHDEKYANKMAPITTLNHLLPSYSTVLKLGPTKKLSSVESSVCFVQRKLPPSYANVDGWQNSPSMISSESVIFGPDPVYIVCPRCRTVVITTIERERSKITHLVALVLCLCLCWPCCLLPYCMRSCNYTYHSCPNCRHYFGMYRPF